MLSISVDWLTTNRFRSARKSRSSHNERAVFGPGHAEQLERRNLLTTYFVNDDAAGGDGSSWASAFSDLHDALQLAETGDQVWVASGIYKPTTGGNRDASFILKNGVSLYGGFAGTELQLSHRDWTANVTTLSGDIGASGDPSDNSYHVVYATNVDQTAILDGFTITGGNADLVNTWQSYGGGIFN